MILSLSDRNSLCFENPLHINMAPSIAYYESDHHRIHGTQFMQCWLVQHRETLKSELRSLNSFGASNSHRPFRRWSVVNDAEPPPLYVYESFPYPFLITRSASNIIDNDNRLPSNASFSPTSFSLPYIRVDSSFFLICQSCLC